MPVMIVQVLDEWSLSMLFLCKHDKWSYIYDVFPLTRVKKQRECNPESSNKEKIHILTRVEGDEVISNSTVISRWTHSDNNSCYFMLNIDIMSRIQKRYTETVAGVFQMKNTLNISTFLF